MFLSGDYLSNCSRYRKVKCNTDDTHINFENAFVVSDGCEMSKSFRNREAETVTLMDKVLKFSVLLKL